MRSVYCILVCAGIISLTGFTAHAQLQGSMDSVIQALTAPGSSISVSDLIGDVTGALTEAMGTTEAQVTAIDAPLVVDTIIPEVNRTVAEILVGDQRTGRYPPRLRINFAEFPLKSLTATNETNNGRTARNGTPQEQVRLRIQSRLGLPQLNLEVEGRTATVSGTAESEHQRSLVESMLRFEPGIDTIKNEIIVLP